MTLDVKTNRIFDKINAALIVKHKPNSVIMFFGKKQPTQVLADGVIYFS